MKHNIEENIAVNQVQNDIRNIEIQDINAYATGSKVLANIVIHVKNGIKTYKILRTKAGGYLMQ